MFLKIRFVSLAVLSLCLLTLSSIRCDCGGAGMPCETSDDCEGYDWPLDCEGDWVCEDEVCIPVCPECEDAQDCEGKIWGNPACDEEEGHWECNQGVCKSICDFECEDPEDCESKTWPAEADCTEDNGHWDCSQGSCVAVCDGCTNASDCEDNEWTKCCTGHWECNDGSCEAICDEGCETAADCEAQDLEWTADEECREDQGHWECSICECVQVCDFNCENVSECLERFWDIRCIGHWACEDGWCTEVCDDVGCSDGDCDEAGGETEASCPNDCAEPCTDSADCIDRLWTLRCQGRFDCQAGQCVALCDYESCGDDNCESNIGESEQSCPADCLEGCETVEDCLDEDWTQLCPGRFNCWLNECQQICDDAMCGNGTCQPQIGESGKSCSADCGRGPCHDATDCFAYSWYEGCNGHWTCTEDGICEETCDSESCSDGTCSVLDGESPYVCPDDCAAYTCQTSDDCDELSLPDGCTGQFLCFERVCWPECE